MLDDFSQPSQAGDETVLGGADTIGSMLCALMNKDSFRDNQPNPAASPLQVITKVAVAYHAVSARKVGSHCGHHDPIPDSHPSDATFLEQMRVSHTSSPFHKLTL